MRLYAPRNLNAPPRWNCSHLKTVSTPAAASKLRPRITGVRCATPARRAAAARTSSKLIASGSAAGSPACVPVCVIARASSLLPTASVHTSIDTLGIHAPSIVRRPFYGRVIPHLALALHDHAPFMPALILLPRRQRSRAPAELRGRARR